MDDKTQLFWFTATILDGQVVTLNEDTLIMPTSRLFSKQFSRLVFLLLRILQWPNGSPCELTQWARFHFFHLFLSQMKKLRWRDMMHRRPKGQPFVLLQHRVQVGSKEGAELVSSVMASFSPGQAGHRLEKRVMTLEGNISHSRLVVERNFPFKTESKRPRVHAPSPNLLGWQGSSHRRRPKYKPSFLPPPKKKNYLMTSAMLIGTWILQEQPSKSAKCSSLQLPALWTRSLWVNPLLEMKEIDLRGGRSYDQELVWAGRKMLRPLGGSMPGPTEIKGKKSR